MIDSRNELRRRIRQDAVSNDINGNFSYVIKLLYGNVNAHAFRYLKSLRKLEYYSGRNPVLHMLYKLRNRRLGLRYSIAIRPDAVGAGLRIPHLEGGVIINCRSMGENCKVNAGVVVGDKGADKNARPTIGNNVELCPGCKVIGDITIGDDVIVAPNSVVIDDVPTGCVVSGIPACIIKYKETR